ncbi:MAG: sodium/proline symporter PutP [Coriobacteriales bacterium]|jgi:sodium/proline symporter|nr:sodium/proline symporter PutP [Coriobacteriales bacterium]
MQTSDILILIAMIIYIAVILGIGFFYAKRSQSSTEEFYLGGRKLGPWVAAMSAEASDMSGWLLMGLPGVAYFTGASEAAWTAIGLACGTYLNWLIVAKRLRKYSQVAGNAITLPDFFSNRFHDTKRILMSVAALFILVFFAIYVGSCFVTTGKLFNTLFGWPYFGMMVVGAILVFIYTLIGGFLAESVSDFVQAMVMVVALIIVLVGSIVSIGGIENVVEFIRSVPGFGSLVQSATPLVDADEVQQVVAGEPQWGEPGGYGFIVILSTLAWGLGYFGMPQVLLRFMAIRSSREIKSARRIATVWCVISLSAAVAIGLIGRALFPDLLLTSSGVESIFIEMSKFLLPALLAGIMLSGIFAATMSSADSYMLIASSAIAQNLFKGLFKRDATDKQVMWAARITMTLILIFGIIVAADENSSIFRVVSYAWAGFGATFGPLVLLSLLWRRVNLPGALAGMVSGGVMIFVWHELVRPLGVRLGGSLGDLLNIYELLPAFIIGLVAIVVVSLLTKPPSEAITKEFDHYMEADV